jgi:hypothetical protein
MRFGRLHALLSRFELFLEFTSCTRGAMPSSMILFATGCTRLQHGFPLSDSGGETKNLRRCSLSSAIRCYSSSKLHPDIRGDEIHCSRICSCQSTQKPQRSTGFRSFTVNISIENTYFHSISTEFNKRYDLFWEQGVVSSNLTAPTISKNNELRGFSRLPKY